MSENILAEPKPAIGHSERRLPGPSQVEVNDFLGKNPWWAELNLEAKRTMRFLLEKREGEEAIEEEFSLERYRRELCFWFVLRQKREKGRGFRKLELGISDLELIGEGFSEEELDQWVTEEWKEEVGREFGVLPRAKSKSHFSLLKGLLTGHDGEVGNFIEAPQFSLGFLREWDEVKYVVGEESEAEKQARLESGEDKRRTFLRAKYNLERVIGLQGWEEKKEEVGIERRILAKAMEEYQIISKTKGLIFDVLIPLGKADGHQELPSGIAYRYLQEKIDNLQNQIREKDAVLKLREVSQKKEEQREAKSLREEIARLKQEKASLLTTRRCSQLEVNRINQTIERRLPELIANAWVGHGWGGSRKVVLTGELVNYSEALDDQALFFVPSAMGSEDTYDETVTSFTPADYAQQEWEAMKFLGRCQAFYKQEGMRDLFIGHSKCGAMIFEFQKRCYTQVWPKLKLEDKDQRQPWVSCVAVCPAIPKSNIFLDKGWNRVLKYGLQVQEEFIRTGAVLENLRERLKPIINIIGEKFIRSFIEDHAPNEIFQEHLRVGTSEDPRTVLWLIATARGLKQEADYQFDQWVSQNPLLVIIDDKDVMVSPKVVIKELLTTAIENNLRFKVFLSVFGHYAQHAKKTSAVIAHHLREVSTMSLENWHGHLDSISDNPEKSNPFIINNQWLKEPTFLEKVGQHWHSLRNGAMRGVKGGFVNILSAFP